MGILKNTQLVRQKSKEHGFDFCGISKAEYLDEHAQDLENWLNNNYNGKMAYMSNHFDKRLDPTKLVPGAKSVVSFIYNYFPKNDLNNVDLKIARYAYGCDYHFVIKDKLHLLLNELRDEIGDINGRVFVDSAPVMERQWAARSGLGWLGKNTLLLNKSMGSYFFLAELITDLELEPDGPVKDHCGNCTKCMDECPTDAFPKQGVLDANKCISYATIELKENIPAEFEGKMADWVFGCDICQEVCPWNRFAKPHIEPLFDPPEELLKISEWEEITEEVFKNLFRESAVLRAGYQKLKKNINSAKKQKDQ